MFREARIEEYVSWLRGFLTAGGTITHCYDYPWARAEFLVVSHDFRLGGECGSSSRPILVQPGARWVGGERGHNNLYQLCDFTKVGNWVPVYADPVFDSLPEVEESRRQARQQQIEFELERSKWKKRVIYRSIWGRSHDAHELVVRRQNGAEC